MHDARQTSIATLTLLCWLGCRCGQLEEQVEQLQLDVAEKQQANGKLEQRLAAAASNLQRKHRLMAEVRMPWTCLGLLSCGVRLL